MENSNSPLISVIIPVYNSERYLTKCLDSVGRQDFKNFEVIIIDDGSTDSSIEIIKEFTNKYLNFKYIQQENMGASAARNKGIKISKGKFISFIDSDDFVDKDFLKDMYKEALDKECDVVCCGYSTYYPKKNIVIKDLFMLSSGVYKPYKFLNIMIRDFRIHYTMWNKLWKRDLFENNNIEYPKMCFEDISTVPKLIYYSNKIAVISKSYYYYTNNKDSLVHTVNVSQLNDYIKSLAMLRLFLENENIYNDFKLSYKLYTLRLFICNLKMIFLIYKKNRDFLWIMKILKKSNSAIIKCLKKDFKNNIGNIDKFPNIV